MVMDKERKQKGGISLIVVSPGEKKDYSGHVQTKMLTDVFTQFHRIVYILTKKNFQLSYVSNKIHLSK